MSKKKRSAFDNVRELRLSWLFYSGAVATISAPKGARIEPAEMTAFVKAVRELVRREPAPPTVQTPGQEGNS